MLVVQRRPKGGALVDLSAEELEIITEALRLRGIEAQHEEWQERLSFRIIDIIPYDPASPHKASLARIHTCLRHEGVVFAGDLYALIARSNDRKYDFNHMLRTPNFGQKSLDLMLGYLKAATLPVDGELIHLGWVRPVEIA